MLKLNATPYPNHCTHGCTNPSPRHSGVTHEIEYLLDLQLDSLHIYVVYYFIYIYHKKKLRFYIVNLDIIVSYLLKIVS